MISIKFLNDSDSQNEIVKDYWNIDERGKFSYTVKQILQKYNLSNANQVVALVNKLATIYNKEIYCTYCGEYYYKYNSRSSLSYKISHSHQQNLICSDCIRKQNQVYIDEKKVFLINLRLNEKKLLNNLSTKQLIYLLTLIKHSASEDGTSINNLINNNNYRLTPHQTKDIELLHFLDYEKICILSNNNINLDFIKKDDDRINAYTYDLFSVYRKVWISDYNGFPDISIIEKMLEERFIIQPLEFYEIAEEILIYECLSFLQYNLEKRSLNIDYSDRAINLFKKLLKSFPVNQIWCIIYSSIAQTSDFILQNKGSYKSSTSFLAGVIFNKIERLAEKSIFNNWNLTPYSRQFDLPQSSISCLIFNTILKTFDGGFSHKLDSLIKL